MRAFVIRASILGVGFSRSISRNPEEHDSSHDGPILVGTSSCSPITNPLQYSPFTQIWEFQKTGALQQTLNAKHVWQGLVVEGLGNGTETDGRAIRNPK